VAIKGKKAENIDSPFAPGFGSKQGRGGEREGAILLPAICCGEEKMTSCFCNVPAFLSPVIRRKREGQKSGIKRNPAVRGRRIAPGGRGGKKCSALKVRKGESSLADIYI